ncbi:MAG: hypothetical protein AAF098_13810 [Pseudomonadota bacterium]
MTEHSEPTPWRALFSVAAPKVWLVLGVYAVIVVSCAWLIPSHKPLADWSALEDERGAWILSPGVYGSRVGQSSYWQGQSQGPGSAMHFASRWVDVPTGAEFLELRICLAEAIAPTSINVFLASEQAAALDFNRQYQLYGINSSSVDNCHQEVFPRLAGDGPAAFQLQIVQPGLTLELTELESRPLIENSQWRLVRTVLLPFGVLLILAAFFPYLKMKPYLATLFGLGALAAILFGCLATVEVKAWVYALLTGGRNLALGESGLELVNTSQNALDPLLREAFPVGGFSIFTYLHAVLYCFACIGFGLLRKSAPLEMALLAPITEIMQYLVPGRGPGLTDAMVDWSGVLVASVLLLGVWRSQRIGLLLKQ